MNLIRVTDSGSPQAASLYSYDRTSNPQNTPQNKQKSNQPPGSSPQNPQNSARTPKTSLKILKNPPGFAS
jgi:hypothetical protein